MSDGGVAFHASVTSGNAPLTVQFTDDTTGYRSAWTWSFGDGGSTAQNPSHTYNSAGTYDVSLAVSNGSRVIGTETKLAYITVYEPSPSKPVSEFKMNTTTGPAPLTVKFTSLASAGSLSYEWDFGDGTQHSAEPTPVHVYTTPNTYKVSLKVSSPGGSDIKTAQIVVTTPIAQGSSNNMSATAIIAPESKVTSDTPQSQGKLTFSISEDLIQIILTALIAIVIAFMVIYYLTSLSKRAENKGAKNSPGPSERKGHMPAISKKSPGKEAMHDTAIKPAEIPANPAEESITPQDMIDIAELVNARAAVKSAEAVKAPEAVKLPETPPMPAEAAIKSAPVKAPEAVKPPVVVKPPEMPVKPAEPAMKPIPVKAAEVVKPVEKPPEPKKSSAKISDLLKPKAKPEAKDQPAPKPAKKRNDVDKDYIYGLVLGENQDDKDKKNKD
ncbi:MAG TPA: PKD domain-containing protein [Methanocella sp.]|uniref:PKD domain-containing protein n=1 Tax=Methanocella sp. TaxID=2052833 RepID=UPI002C1A1BED|nr:PKD domain-containing protein [Methanocella sp.]HTY89845.1 PKD domain-containing protein [Methanocella sp.]